MRALVEHAGIGWTVPLGSSSALADVVERLADHPEEVTQAGQRGIEFMRERDWHREHGRRLAHLASVAQG